MRILITDADNRSALAAVRSLGRQGHTVLVAGDRQPALASVSRYCSQFVQYPSPVHDPEGFVSAIIETVRTEQIDLLLPMTEISTLLLTAAESQLPVSVRLPFASAQTVAFAADKGLVLQRAQELQVPIPATQVCQNPAHAQELASQLHYPVVIKATRSRVWSGSRWLSTSVKYATDSTSFLGHIDEISPRIYPLLLQERIEGPGVGVFLCYGDHGPIASFAHQRLREKPPSGGVSVLSESVPVDTAALEYATRLLDSLQWRGVAMVEFKRDLRDNSLKLMEINGRFWGSLQLAIDAGVDFPGLLVDIAQGNHPQQQPYRLGVRTRWLLGDLDSLLTVLLRNPGKINLPASHPGRLRTLLSFLKPNGRNTRMELERCDDLKPARLAARRWLSGEK